MSVEHKTQALAIHCIDFRFQQMISEHLAESGLTGQFDRISLPGASKDLDQVLQYAQVSIRLHDPDQVLIYEHQDCGAYGQDNSLETHRQSTANLANALKDIKPRLKIETFFATFEGITNL